MGTNLSQVFVSNINGATVEAGTTSNDSFTQIASGEVGVWDLGGMAWVNTALYKGGVDLTDEVATATLTNEVTDDLTTVANPLWLYNNLQFVQGTAGNPLATPMINVRNIRRISHDPYAETKGHKVVLTPGALTSTTIGDVSVRFVIRTQPTDIMSYHDANATNYTILAGNDPLPLGAFNTTNHKVITVDIAEEDYSSAATLIDKIVAGVQSHGLLSKMIKVTDGSTTCTLESKHVGLIFDVAISNEAGDSIIGSGANLIASAITGQKLGVGNPWQVLGEEIRCRSRYGNFNRMYLPQNPVTYTQADGKYNKIVIEYEHNWPTSTGIAPAGTLNQCVIYFDSDGAAVTTSEGDFDAIFGIADLTESYEFMW